MNEQAKQEDEVVLKTGGILAFILDPLLAIFGKRVMFRLEGYGHGIDNQIKSYGVMHECFTLKDINDVLVIRMNKDDQKRNEKINDIIGRIHASTSLGGRVLLFLAEDVEFLALRPCVGDMDKKEELSATKVELPEMQVNVNEKN